MQAFGSQFDELADRMERARLASRLQSLRVAAAKYVQNGLDVPNGTIDELNSVELERQNARDDEYLRYLAGRMDPRD